MIEIVVGAIAALIVVSIVEWRRRKNLKDIFPVDRVPLRTFLTGELDRMDHTLITRPEVVNREGLWAIEIRYPIEELRACLSLGRSFEQDRYRAMIAKAREDFGGLPTIERTAIGYSIHGHCFTVTYFSREQ